MFFAIPHFQFVFSRQRSYALFAAFEHASAVLDTTLRLAINLVYAIGVRAGVLLAAPRIASQPLFAGQHRHRPTATFPAAASVRAAKHRLAVDFASADSPSDLASCIFGATSKRTFLHVRVLAAKHRLAVDLVYAAALRARVLLAARHI